MKRNTNWFCKHCNAYTKRVIVVEIKLPNRVLIGFKIKQKQSYTWTHEKLLNKFIVTKHARRNIFTHTQINQLLKEKLYQMGFKEMTGLLLS